MSRFHVILSFLALAAAAFTANGAQVVDLTAAARRAGASSYSVTTTSQGSSHQAKTAFDGVYSGNSAQAWHSVDTNNYDDETNVYSGEDGTVWYVNVIRNGIMLLFR